MGRTIAIVPAFNEAPRIGAVLDVVTKSPHLDKVFVVDDGSIDGTSEVARPYPVHLLVHPENLGKGAALQTALEVALAEGADRFVFLDADLIGLSDHHIGALLAPLEDPTHPRMIVGAFEGGKKSVDLAQKYFRVLNGQRGLTRAMAEALPDLAWARFGVEVLMNLYTMRRGLELIYIPLKNIDHYTKEQKLGFFKGFRYRLQMFQEAIYAWRNFERLVDK